MVSGFQMLVRDGFFIHAFFYCFLERDNRTKIPDIQVIIFTHLFRFFAAVLLLDLVQPVIDHFDRTAYWFQHFLHLCLKFFIRCRIKFLYLLSFFFERLHQSVQGRPVLTHLCGLGICIGNGCIFLCLLLDLFLQLAAVPLDLRERSRLHLGRDS